MSLKNQEVTYTPSGTRAERKSLRKAATAESLPQKRKLGQRIDQALERRGDRERLAGDWGGSREPQSLWGGPHRLRPAPHRASTMTFAAAYPFITESGLGHEEPT